jgi:heptosyltransferase II
MQTLALFLPNWIGDVVMATPAIRAIRRQWPHARIVAVGKPYIAEVVAGSPCVDEFVPLDKSGPRHRRFVSVMGRLRDERLDAAVLFPNSFRIALLAKLAGTRRIVGFARYGRDMLLTDRLYPARGADRRPKPTPIIDDYNRLAMKLGTPNPGHRQELFTQPSDDAAAVQFWTRHKLDRYSRIVGFNPGGAFGASKHWPTGHFVELANRFAADRRTAVVVLCGPSERDEATKIAAGCAKPNIVSLADAELSLGLSKAIVKRLNLLVTTDSGPRHFAAAFDVPVVTLFGPTHIAWTETYFAKASHLQEKLPCGPCQQRVCPQGHHRCMTELRPTAAYEASCSLLAQTHDTVELRHVG